MTTTVRRVGVRDEYAPQFGRQRLTIWSGPFASNYEGSATELPRHDGYMLTISHFLWSHKVRVLCESPRTDENWMRVDDAIRAAYEEAETACEKEREMNRKPDLAYGARQYLLPGTKAAWGARLIVTQDGHVDLVPDRQDVAGDPELVERTKAWLDDGALPTTLANIADGLRCGNIKTREERGHWLYEDGRGIALGNTHASAGYLYVVGWLFDALPDGCKTKGADLLVEEITTALKKDEQAAPANH